MRVAARPPGPEAGRLASGPVEDAHAPARKNDPKQETCAAAGFEPVQDVKKTVVAGHPQPGGAQARLTLILVAVEEALLDLEDAGAPWKELEPFLTLRKNVLEEFDRRVLDLDEALVRRAAGQVRLVFSS